MPGGAVEQSEPSTYTRDLHHADPSDSKSPDSLDYSDPVTPTVRLAPRCRWLGGPAFAAPLYPNEAQAN